MDELGGYTLTRKPSRSRWWRRADQRRAKTLRHCVLCAVCCVLLIVYCISCVLIVAIPPFAAAEKVPCQGVLVAEEGEEEVYTSLGLD